MPAWNLVTNHGAVLALISRHRQITAREIAAELGITERSVHRIISQLEGEGLLERTREGRVNRYSVSHDSPLQRVQGGEVPLGDLLELLLPGSTADRKAATPRRKKVATL